LLDHWRGTLASPAKPPSEEVGRLSRRELSVLGLVAHGWSNAEIAEELVLGEATVKTHVSRILTKLDLRNRVQLAAFAHRNGLTV
jgi:DNA-binding NarL/FixJ family response regulator